MLGIPKPQYEITLTATESDIELYIIHQIQYDPNRQAMTMELQDDIIKVLKERANGMYVLDFAYYNIMIDSKLLLGSCFLLYIFIWYFRTAQLERGMRH